MLSTFILLVAVVNAGVVPVNNVRYARPGYLIARQIPESSTSTEIPVITVTATATPAVADAQAAALLNNAAVVVSTCTPSTTCVDGLACSSRWGGCYDYHFCSGATLPFPTPTCTSLVIPGWPPAIPAPAPTLEPARAVENDDEQDDDVVEQEQDDGSAVVIVDKQ